MGFGTKVKVGFRPLFVKKNSCFHVKFTISLNGFPGDSGSKDSACNTGDPGFIPGSGRSPGEGNGYPLHYPCLENPMDRGAWQITVHGSKELDTAERLTLTFTLLYKNICISNHEHHRILICDGLYPMIMYLVSSLLLEVLLDRLGGP